MMQARWTNTIQSDHDARLVLRTETPGDGPPPHSVAQSGTGEHRRKQPIWPLLVILFGLGCSAAWGGLLLWLVFRL